MFTYVHNPQFNRRLSNLLSWLHHLHVVSPKTQAFMTIIGSSVRAVPSAGKQHLQARFSGTCRGLPRGSATSSAGAGLSSLIRTAAMEDPSVVWGIQSTDSLAASDATTGDSDAYGSCLSSSTLHLPRLVMQYHKNRPACTCLTS